MWPLWYLDSDLHRPGPHPWLLGGEPVRRRDGRPLVTDVRVRVKLPVCLDCNAALEKRFERPTAELIRRVFSERGRVVLAAAEAERAALWLLKTWLLHGHPQVHYSEPVVDRLDIIRMSDLLPDECYRWLVHGDDPPDGLSLWVSRTVDDGRSERDGPIVPLPVVHTEGGVVRFVAHEVTLHGLTVVVVFHPGWPVINPHEATGCAARLWPRQGRVDLGALEPVPLSAGVRWSHGWRLTFKDGMFDAARLPALAATADPIRFFLTMMGIFIVKIGR